MNGDGTGSKDQISRTIMNRLLKTPSRALVLSAALLSGCASHGPDLPEYVDPKLEPAKAATVQAGSGTYIITVDNTAIPGQIIKLDNFGGNKVLLTPGQHRSLTKQA